MRAQGVRATETRGNGARRWRHEERAGVAAAAATVIWGLESVRLRDFWAAEGHRRLQTERQTGKTVAESAGSWGWTESATDRVNAVLTIRR